MNGSMSGGRGPFLFAAFLVIAAAAGDVAAEDLENWFWLHHSVGRYIIADGQVRQKISDYNLAHGKAIEFWDHDYNYIGLMHPDGVIRWPCYHIPDDANTPELLHNLWTTENDARTLIVTNHQAIAFKPGYLSCNTESNQQLGQYQQYYREIRDQFDLYAVTHPDRIFIVMPPTPLHWRQTTLEEADRARAFANWLKSSRFLMGHPNVYTFDIFDLLAHPDDGSEMRNILKLEYTDPDVWYDSHPTYAGNIVCAQAFFDFMIEVTLDPGQGSTPGRGPVARLSPNWPNPFNPSTSVVCTLAEPGPVTLSVFDLDGQLIRTLLDARMGGGSRRVIWDGLDGAGRSAASGVYVLKLETEDGVEARKVTLTR